MVVPRPDPAAASTSATQPPAAPRLRHSHAAAVGCRDGRYAARADRYAVSPRSWLHPVMWWRARAELTTRFVDRTDGQRARWLNGVSTGELTLSLPQLREFSFVVMGDTGEGDRSQYVLVPALERSASDVSFAVICGDVIYPAGSVDDYARKFLRPYEDWQVPIYAIPGNHDWYDGLHGFMHFFCGRDRPTTFDLDRWRADDGPALLQRRLKPVPRQRTPYFSIETEHLRILCIDPGPRAHLDPAQSRWLIEQSRGGKPKILITGGKPLIVNGRTEKTALRDTQGGYGTVLDVVMDAEHHYVAAIGGDTHNYQRYPVPLDGRRLQVIVSGGGGAFMHATHIIKRIDPHQARGVTEEEFRCFPLRRDSLAAYTRVLAAKLPFARSDTRAGLDSGEAAVILRDGLDLPSQPDLPVPPARLSLGDRLAGGIVRRIGGKAFQRVVSPWLDWDQPPLFKQFLRIDVDARGITGRCIAATGCVQDDDVEHVEDLWRADFPR